MNKEQGPPPVDLLEDLLNTDDRFHGVDILRQPDGLARVAAHLGLREDRLPVAELIRLRDALRTHVVGAADAPALSALAAAHPLRLEFTDDGVRVVGDTPLAEILALVQRAAAAGSWARLRSCRNPDCGWIYYDASKNASGRWCSTECSHVMRSRAYRARKAG